MARAYKALPPASELWERFEYNPLTGVLYRNGKPAGCKRNDGYWCISVAGTLYLRHRLVYGWVNGVDPGAFIVDHANRVPGDDKSWNLRLATPGESSRNVKARGVYPRRGKYQAKICVNRKQIILGTFSTEAEARAAYEKASLELHGEFSGVR